MVIVQVASRNSPGPVDNIKTDELEPYQPNKADPYIAAYFNVESGTPSTFVIGDGKTYKFDNKDYVNNPLKQNSSYIVFLRFFEKEVNSMQSKHFASRFWTKTKKILYLLRGRTTQQNGAKFSRRWKTVRV